MSSHSTWRRKNRIDCNLWRNCKSSKPNTNASKQRTKHSKKEYPAETRPTLNKILEARWMAVDNSLINLHYRCRLWWANAKTGWVSTSLLSKWCSRMLEDDSWLLIVYFEVIIIEFSKRNKGIGWSFEADMYIVFIKFNQFLWVLLSQL